MVQRQQRNVKRPLKYIVTERWRAILIPPSSLIAWKRTKSITFPSSEDLRFGGRSRGKGLGVSIPREDCEQNVPRVPAPSTVPGK